MILTMFPFELASDDGAEQLADVFYVMGCN